MSYFRILRSNNKEDINMSTSLRKGISVLLAGTIAMTSMMGAMAAIGPISGSENIPYNVL